MLFYSYKNNDLYQKYIIFYFSYCTFLTKQFTKELRYKWIKHVFITVGERKMTSFTSSFHGSCQTGEESRRSENGMTLRRTAFRSNCFIVAFLRSFLNHTMNENKDRESVQELLIKYAIIFSHYRWFQFQKNWKSYIFSLYSLSLCLSDLNNNKYKHI